jgi:hypothetical protein
LKSERSFYVQIFRIWIIKYQWSWYSIIIVPIEIFFLRCIGMPKASYSLAMLPWTMEHQVLPPQLYLLVHKPMNIH